MTPELSIQRIFSEPPLLGVNPSHIQFSPDNRYISYLSPSNDDVERMDLWAYDLNGQTLCCLVNANTLNNNADLSEEEKDRRERRRIFNSGIVEYHWSKNATQLLLPINGQLFLYQIADHSYISITTTADFATDARFSPEGNYVSYIQQQNIHYYHIASASTKALTFDGAGLIKNGMAEFIAQEEMHRFTGYWWSPDETKIAYLQVDESPVRISQRYEIDAQSFKIFDQRYPYTGEDNVTTKILVAPLNGNIKTIDYFPSCSSIVEPDAYIGRITWHPNSQQLAVQKQSRNQQNLELLLLDVESQQAQRLLLEQHNTWLNLFDEFKFLGDGQYFIWPSEVSGIKQLHLYKSSSKKELGIVSRQVARVEELLSCRYWDGHWQLIYNGSPAEAELPALEQQLFQTRFKLQGDQIEFIETKRISQQAGWHKGSVSSDGAYYIDNFSSPQHLPKMNLYHLNTAKVEPNPFNNPSPTYNQYLQRKPQQDFGSIKADDGQDLYYRCSHGEHPNGAAIVFVYGGPGAQRVKKEWISPFTQHMCEQGFTIMELDNRGSSNRAKAFEDPIFGQLGDIEVDDQILGVQTLLKRYPIDPQRIGMFGHSYGGYMTLMSLFKASQTFSAGVAVAPVTDWSLYDTHYTERYLGTPQDNPQGYADSGVFDHLEGLNSALLVMHGMADDNVLFTNSTKLFHCLQQADKAFEVMTYPGAKHAIGGRANNIHRYKMISEFFKRQLS